MVIPHIPQPTTSFENPRALAHHVSKLWKDIMRLTH